MYRYTCKICLKKCIWSGVSISMHLRTAHNMSLATYTSQYESEPRSVNSQSQANVGADNPSTSTLSNARAIAPKPWFAPGSSITPWYNKCSWTCQICGCVVNSSSYSFTIHLQNAHKMLRIAYEKKYGYKGIRHVDHQCQLCFELYPWNSNSLATHFKASHGESLASYAKKFPTYIRSCPSENEYYEPTGNRWIAPERLTSDPSSFKVIKKEKEVWHVCTTCGEKCSSKTALQEHRLLHHGREWFQKCRYTCQICGKAFSAGNFLTLHCKKTHMMDKVEYVKHFGLRGVEIRSYGCKLCGKQLTCEAKVLSSHFSVHGLTLAEYGAMYETQHQEEAATTETDPLDINTGTQQDPVDGDGDRILIPDEEEDADYKMSVEEEDDILVANLGASSSPISAEDDDGDDDMNANEDEGDDQNNCASIGIINTNSMQNIRNIFDSDSDDE